VSLLWLLAALLTSARAPGQAATEEALTPPRVVRSVKAELPPNAGPLEQPVAVVLEITIDVDGRVGEARVAESATPELDASALEALKQYEFQPALRGGQPIAVTIRYRYVFEPEAREAEPPAPAGKPAPPPSRPPAAPPAVTHGPEPAKPGPDELLEYEATAEIEAPPRTVIRRSFEAEQLAKVPGARGDAIRAVDVLPGVARGSSFGDGNPIVRGAHSLETQVFLDGTPVPLLFHFGGLTSFFQSRLLDRVELYPGNFSARYGRVSSAVVEVKVRDPREDRFHAMVDLSVIDSAAMAEAPLGEDFGVAVGARRSNIDFFFEQFVPEDAYSVVAAPVYYDYQALAVYRLGGGDRLRLMGYGSRDSFEILFSEPDDADPTLRGAVGGSAEFHQLNLRLDTHLSKDVRHTSSVTFGIQDLEFNLGPWRQQLRSLDLFGRSELAIEFSSAVELDFGIDAFASVAEGFYEGPRPGGFDGNPEGDERGALAETFQFEDDEIPIAAAGFWTELLLRPAKGLLLAPGFRADYYQNLDDWTLDPRVSSRIELTPRTTLKAGVGLFSQPPLWYEALAGVGNPNLDPYHAIHYGAGLEQKVGEGVEVGIEGFYKWIWNRVVGTDGQQVPYLVNDGEGRVVGAELNLTLRPSARTFAYAAYTLSRSERKNRDQQWVLFENDQTHVLSATATHRLGRGWEVGARFRFASGNPQTPVIAAVYDARLDQYRPVYGPFNSQREANFHQLDLRVEKQWQLTGDFKLAAYLELLNAYNSPNQEGTRYSYDYSRSEALSGLPILPNLGIRGEL
jgi:TonB family protein